MRPFAFYQHQLDQVSRSFALCIPQLAPPFREQVALAYLLLRVLDTVEDAPFDDRNLQAAQFSRMRRFLVERPRASEIATFIRDFPAAITDTERGLIRETEVLFEDAYELDLPTRVAMFDAIDRMAAGMAAYAQRGLPLRLVDTEDVTRYCCFVAGLVGEMLTKLWTTATGRTGPAMLLAYHFGIFLQKVNILKDREEDEASQRFLVPDRHELLATLRIHARGALGYIQALPPEARGYRVFCAWSLVMGATTISTLDRPRESRREDTARLLARTADIAHDNRELHRLVEQVMPRLPELSPRWPLPKPESLSWFRTNLAAPLTVTELSHLGIANDPTAAA
jgi:phytoene/squalene synthetase